jgi:hypothetical protein
MPEACPIGMDGGGGFYLLDMRLTLPDGDYPVLWAHAGNLGFEEAMPLAQSFNEFMETALGTNST